MDRAFELAEEALNAGEVPVGCVFVYDGKVIACGRNEVSFHLSFTCCALRDRGTVVVFSSRNDRFGGCGSVMSVNNDDSLRPPLSCEFDMQSDRSINLLKKFFEQENLNAPEEKRIKKTNRCQF
ncbi:unnamed protein product [Taenia asiatica]|uniref:CMP/dCMP-type deaminase domain-containing protein n=1 Tax=Taenia asiatica TaxID=60517 RepID=A0A0R3VUD4_TAEAS|nr:unnamed protein product [Taenia asiatica]